MFTDFKNKNNIKLIIIIIIEFI